MAVNSYKDDETSVERSKVQTLKRLFTYLFAYLFICVCRGGPCMPWHACGGQRTSLGSPFSHSTIWVPELEFRSSGLASSIFALWAILSGLFYFTYHC